MLSAAQKANSHNRDYILFFVNGKEHRAFRQDAFLPLSDFLRYNTNAYGTKVVCAEGDCGACTVMVGRPSQGMDEIAYKAVNACIQYVFQLDCSSIVTVEGLGNEGQLNAVQTAMVECHGAQCGYCTPGFVVALSGLIEDCQRQRREATLRDVKESLTEIFVDAQAMNQLLRPPFAPVSGLSSNRSKRLMKNFRHRKCLKHLKITKVRKS